MTRSSRRYIEMYIKEIGLVGVVGVILLRIGHNGGVL